MSANVPTQGQGELPERGAVEDRREDDEEAGQHEQDHGDGLELEAHASLRAWGLRPACRAPRPCRPPGARGYWGYRQNERDHEGGGEWRGRAARGGASRARAAGPGDVVRGAA